MRIYNGSPCVSLKEVVLFPFDDYSIPFQRGMQLKLVGRQAGEVVVAPGPPGAPDSQAIAFYGTVRRVGDEFWMWYLGRGDKADDHLRLCFATSRDGYHWQKPELGLVEYNGSTKNNLVDLCGGKFALAASTVLFDPEEADPDRRFKIVFETHQRNPAHGTRAEFNVAFSADGIRWTERPVHPHDLSCEMSGVMKLNGCYYVTAQSGGGHPGPPRKLETFISYDFEHWLPAGCLGLVRGQDLPRHLSNLIHAGEQVHLGAGLWNRGSVIIGLYGQWHGTTLNDSRFVSIDLGLVVSNDGLHYREPIPDFRMIAASTVSKGSTASAQRYRYPALQQGQGFENIGDETLIWYGAWSYSDGVYVASWPRDRLGYFQAFLGNKMRSLQESHFVSAPIDLEDKPARVFLNVDGLSEHAHVTVEVISEHLEELSGYSQNDCVRLAQSGLREPVRWQSCERIESTRGPVRLRLRFGGLRPEDIKIYALYVEECD